MKRKYTLGAEVPRGRKSKQPFTPSEILFEIQLQARGFIEIDIAMRTTDPMKYEKHLVGAPTRIRGLEPGEIMKLRRDLQAFLLQWRARLALERNDLQVEQRMQIDELEARRARRGDGAKQSSN